MWKVQTNPLGLAQQVTTTGAGSQESRSSDWSKPGRIAYQFGAPGVRGIHLIKPDGTGDVRLTFSTGVERDPSWSPDGRFIAYVSQPTGATNYDLRIHDTNGTPDDTSDDQDYCLGDGAGCLLQGAGTQEFRPAWSPTGDIIAFVTTAPGATATGSNAKIAIVPVNVVNGTVQTVGSFTILTDNTFINFDPTWSPDGQFIAYSTTRNGNRDIYRMSTSGETDVTQFVRLTTNSANETNPAWSPDGTVIAFVTDRDGNSEIYQMSASAGESDLTNLKRITNDPGSDDDPSWGPDHVAEQYRPIMLGTSGANINAVDFTSGAVTCQTGTLGSLVQDASGIKYILSNNHVLARVNKAAVGEAITQPGFEGDCTQNFANTVATLSNFAPIAFGSRSRNTIDAAIAMVGTNTVSPTGSILEIGNISSIPITPTLNMSVKKSGRTTALTTGSVTSLAAKITITYSTGQKAIFVNQIGFSQFDQAGDSGSLIVQNVDPSPAPVALLTGQAKKGGSVQTFGNPIGDVLAYFKVCFVDSSGTCVAPASAVGAGQPLLADPKLQAIYSVTQRYDAVLSAIPGVVGYGIGHSSNGAGQLVIQVFVVDASRIRGILPAALDKVPIEIIETGEIQAR